MPIITYKGKIVTNQGGFLIKNNDLPSYTNGYLYNSIAYLNASFAPSGYRIPTLADSDILKSYIGASTGGSKLKVNDANFWNPPNTNASDIYQFSALGSGFRNENGTFSDLKFATFFAISTIDEIIEDITFYWNIALYNSSEYYANNSSSSKYGISVRFIKNDSTNDGQVLDYDGNSYKTVKIGNQVWTSQNWKCTKLNNIKFNLGKYNFSGVLCI